MKQKCKKSLNYSSLLALFSHFLVGCLVGWSSALASRVFRWIGQIVANHSCLSVSRLYIDECVVDAVKF